MTLKPETAWGRGFPSTHWTEVLAAGSLDDTAGRAALGSICGAYWHPLYAFARRLGYSPADAQDLTQSFFARLIEQPFLDRADAGRGRFRSFLLGAFKLHLAREREREGARKRGGGQVRVSMEVATVEAALAPELTAGRSPDQVYERAWAVSILDEAMRRLEKECAQRGRLEWFRSIQPCLEREAGAARYRELAARLGTTEATIQSGVIRARRRYLRLLREVIEQTVGSPEAVDIELRHLREVLRG